MDYKGKIEKEKIKIERKKAGKQLLIKALNKVDELVTDTRQKRIEKRAEWLKENFNSLAIKYIDEFIVKSGTTEQFSIYIYKRVFSGENNIFSNSIILTKLIERLQYKHKLHGTININDEFLDCLFSHIKAHLEAQSQLTVELKKTNKTFITYGKEEEFLKVQLR